MKAKTLLGISFGMWICSAVLGCAPRVDSPEARYEATVRARAWFESGKLRRAASVLSDMADDSNDPIAWTNLGLVQRQAGKPEAAERSWTRALGADHACAAASYWLGVSRQERAAAALQKAAAGGRQAEKLRTTGEELLAGAVQALESAAGADPTAPIIQRALAAAYRDQGKEPAAVRAEAEARRLDPTGLATLENSELATLQLPPRPHGGGAGQISMRFESQGVESAATGVAAADVDGDGRPEILLLGTAVALRSDSLQDGMHWTARPLLPEGTLVGAVSLDLDTDDRADLVLLSSETPVAAPIEPPAPRTTGSRSVAPAPVQRVSETRVWCVRGGQGAPEPLGTVPYAVQVARAADLDHDGDLDLVVATDTSPALRLWRNTGGRLEFDSPITGFLGLAAAREIACTDLDGDRRIDVVCIDRAGRVRVFLQAREGAFVDASANSGMLQERARVLATADVDADGWTDLLLGNDTGLWVYGNRGAACFVRTASYRAPQTRYYAETTPRVPVAALCLDDLDNDGLLDAITLHPRVAPAAPAVSAVAPAVMASAGNRPSEDAAPEPPMHLGALPSDLRAWRSDGRGVLLDDTLPLELGGDTLMTVVPVAADFDADGDLDLACVAADSTVVVKWNRGGNANRRLLVEVVGPNGRRDGLGARVEIHSGGVVHGFEVLDQPVWSGIHTAERLAAVRIVWPDGTAQDGLDVEIPANGRVRWARTP